MCACHCTCAAHGQKASQRRQFKSNGGSVLLQAGLRIAGAYISNTRLKVNIHLLQAGIIGGIALSASGRAVCPLLALKWLPIRFTIRCKASFPHTTIIGNRKAGNAGTADIFTLRKKILTFLNF